MEVVALILVFVAGLCKGMADALMFHYNKTWARQFNWKETYWNPSISWRNKYKKNIVMLGPKFFGSTTFLVFLTDGWHLLQSIMITCIIVALAVFPGMLDNIILDFILFRLIFFLGFKITYK